MDLELLEKRVGIFGGSFNPVHTGHVEISKSFLKSGLIHELLVLLTPTPPHKNQRDLVGTSHRLQMLNIAFQSLEKVYISDLETTLPEPSYTLQTIEYLQQTEPHKKFFLCIGEDSLIHFHQWYKYKKIIERVPLIVAERPNMNSTDVDPEILERTIFIDHDPLSISSTSIRENLSTGQNQVPKEVMQYIKKHGLYQEADLKTNGLS